MLEMFRGFMRSKIGIGVTLGFLVLIALAFASGDVASSGGFGGVAGGDRVAVVGKKRISTSSLSQGATGALENMKQKDPRASMKGFLAQGGLEEVLEEMINRTAVQTFGEQHGIVAGDRLVDSEIAKIGAFKGADGKFSETAFRQTLQQRGLSEQLVRDDLAQGLISRQILTPAQFGAAPPMAVTLRLAAVVTESRKGAIALLPSAAFAPKTPPTDAELAAWYASQKSNYIRPERRVVRFASFGPEALKNVAAPTEAEIADRYKANSAAYAPSETRSLTQLILPTEAAAKAVLAELAGGKSLEAVAKAKGLSAAPTGSVTRTGLAGMASQAVADASFTTARGKVAGPARSPLGWHLMRVDTIEAKPGKTLAQARGDIVEQLNQEKRRAALVDLSARIEDEFDNGSTLSDVAKELGATISMTLPITADGAVYGKPGENAPPVLARVIQTAFAMDRENQPQLAEVEPGKTFLIFDVGNITASAPAPLAEIRDELTIDYQLAKGSTAAKAAADKVQAAVRKGADLAAAMAAVGVPLPPVDRVDMPRQALGAQQQVPPPLVMLFSMAKGTVKLQEAPRNRGWYVVQLSDVIPGKVDPADPRLAGLASQLAPVIGEEYAEQMRRAIRKEVGVTRNESAIKAVATQLTGGN